MRGRGHDGRTKNSRLRRETTVFRRSRSLFALLAELLAGRVAALALALGQGLALDRGGDDLAMDEEHVAQPAAQRGQQRPQQDLAHLHPGLGQLFLDLLQLLAHVGTSFVQDETILPRSSPLGKTGRKVKSEK